MTSVFDAKIIEVLQPFGVPGLAIAGVVAAISLYYSAVRPRQAWKTRALLTIALTFALAAIPAIPYALRPKTAWISVNVEADWVGRDESCTESHLPSPVKCDEQNVGAIATCWRNRNTSGLQGQGFEACSGTNLTAWCAYKTRGAVKVGTPPDGKATPGAVYVCGKSVF